MTYDLRMRRPCGFRIGLLASLLLLAACASQQARIDRFSEFAAAGSAFTKAVDPVLDESFAASAGTSAQVLLQARDGLDAAGRLAALEQADADLDARLAILGDLKRHLRLLQAYFEALAALSGSDAETSGMTGVAQGLVDALRKLDPRLADAAIGGRRLADLLGPATRFAFAARQSQVLDQELKRNASTIEREIRLQEAALQALAEAYVADRETLAAQVYRDKVALPFAADRSLASSWAGTRADLLQERIETTPVQAAADAASRLRASFVALVENRLDGARLAALLTDVNAIVAAIHDTGTAAPEAPKP